MNYVRLAENEGITRILFFIQNSVQHCLVVHHDQRYTVDEALSDAFFDDDDCRRDLEELEDKIGQRWLTNIRINPQESFDEDPNISVTQSC